MSVLMQYDGIVYNVYGDGGTGERLKWNITVSVFKSYANSVRAVFTDHGDE